MRRIILTLSALVVSGGVALAERADQPNQLPTTLPSSPPANQPDLQPSPLPALQPAEPTLPAAASHSVSRETDRSPSFDFGWLGLLGLVGLFGLRGRREVPIADAPLESSAPRTVALVLFLGSLALGAGADEVVNGDTGFFKEAAAVRPTTPPM